MQTVGGATLALGMGYYTGRAHALSLSRSRLKERLKLEGSSGECSSQRARRRPVEAAGSALHLASCLMAAPLTTSDRGEAGGARDGGDACGGGGGGASRRTFDVGGDGDGAGVRSAAHGHAVDGAWRASGGGGGGGGGRGGRRRGAACSGPRDGGASATFAAGTCITATTHSLWVPGLRCARCCAMSDGRRIPKQM
jgi:hypothetical protein